MSIEDLLSAVQVKAGLDEPADKFTDAVLGGRFAREALTNRFYYTKAVGWLHWDNQRWAECADEIVHEHARKWVLDMYFDAVSQFAERAKAGQLKDGEKLSEDPQVKGWSAAQAMKRLTAMTQLARGNELIFRDAAQFDADPRKLNTPSGIVDLLTGEIKPHDPAGMHSKITKAAYRKEAANSPLIAQALMAYPRDTWEWLQVRLGEACTGIGGKELVLLDGSGNNGKTALTGAVRDALGSYAAVLSNTLLLSGSTKGAATPEKMDLRGLRFGYMEETPEGSYLEANVVKELLDANSIKGRQLYKGFVEWKPSHSLFLNTNNLPSVADTDDGPWRRLVRIHCPYRFRDVEGGEPIELETDRPADVTLKDRLSSTTAGREAVLAWAIQGAVKFLSADSLKQAAQTPASVDAATRDWRKTSDDLLRFIDSYMEFDPNGWVVKADLYGAFRRFLIDSGQKPISMKTMAQRIGQHGLIRARVVAVQKVAASDPPSRPQNLLENGLVEPIPSRPHGYSGLVFQDSGSRQASDQDF